MRYAVADIDDFDTLEMGCDHCAFTIDEEIDGQIGCELAELSGWDGMMGAQAPTHLEALGAEKLVGTELQAEILGGGSDREFAALGEAAEIEEAYLSGNDSIGFIAAAIALTSAAISAGVAISKGVRAAKARKAATGKAGGAFLEAAGPGLASSAAQGYGGYSAEYGSPDWASSAAKYGSTAAQYGSQAVALRAKLRGRTTSASTAPGTRTLADQVRGIGQRMTDAAKTAKGVLTAANGGTSVFKRAKDAKEKKRQDIARRKAAAKLAQLMIRAKKGDQNAREILTMVKILKSPEARKSGFRSAYKAKFGKAPTKELAAKAVKHGAYKGRWNSVVKAARKIAIRKGIKSIKRKIPDDKEVVKAGIRGLVKASARKEAREGKPKTSRRKKAAAKSRLSKLQKVKAARAKKKGKKGALAKRAKSAILVLPGGKIQRGKFAKVAA